MIQANDRLNPDFYRDARRSPVLTLQPFEALAEMSGIYEQFR